MRLLKPNWVSHDGRPIFSVDIHPDGSRFATGGQGDDCGKVAIWNMGPLKVEEEELNHEIPRLLCQMDNHLACVNCVRWSNNGKYLASGGDDNLVMIWQMARYTAPMTTFGGGGGKLNIEQWRCVHNLKQHDGDVLDLSWSPDDSFLASASVDNTISIWNAQRFPEVIQVLKGHTGLVKGVTWDPVGKYLASQADDKTLKVWRTSDWQQEASVTEPFLECSGTTHVLRLSWSPDGHYVVSAHAMNNSGPVAKILERDGWKTRMDFVGHRKAITCVRFNPKLFVKKVNGDSSRLKQYSCCAIGCRDRSLSIWLTSLKRPLVVVHDLFNHSVMDMSWSQTGFELLVCSWDGTVAYADFSSEELGKAMSQQEKEKFHKQVYGISISSNKTKFASSIIENPEMLKIQQRHLMKQQTEANIPKPSIPPPPLVPSGATSGTPTKQENSQLSNGISSVSRAIFSSPSSSSNTSVKEQQKETRTKDGRRRITPVLVAQMDVNDTPLPFGSSCTAQPPPAPATSSTINSSDFSKIPTSQSLSALHSRIGEQAMTGFKESSKDNLITTKAPIPVVKATSITSKSPAKSLSLSRQSSPSKQASSTTSSSTLMVKRKNDTPTGASKRPRKDKEQASRSVSASSRQKEDRSEHDESVTAIVATRHTVCIPSPSPEKTLTVQIGGGDGSVTLELENNLSSSVNAVNVLKCTSGGHMSWEAMVTSPGIALAGNRNIVCVACLNKTLNVFSFGGTRLMPALVLDGTASMLLCNGYYVMVVTSSGSVYVWDAKKRSAVVQNGSAVSILSGNDVSIARASISERGYPVITLSNQSSYSFEPEFGAWIQLVRAEDPLALNADYKSSSTPRQDPFEVRGPLSQLQGQSTRLAHQGGRLFRSNPGRQQTATVSHLENQLAACLALGSGNEYHFWLMTYVRYLVQSGLESRIRDVCDEFLGPPYRSTSQSKSSTWTPRILGYLKKELLREILHVIGTNIRLQRLFTEYKDQLDAAELRT